MTLLRISPAGGLGVNRDLSSSELPSEAWTDARNVRFVDGMAWQFLGHGEVYSGAPVVPHHLAACNVGGARYWIYAGLSKLYGVTGSGGSVTHTNLTRQTSGVDVDYAGAPNAWTSTLLSGIPILNPGNGVDPPQRWDLNTGHRFQALDHWPAATFCRSMRAYKNVLVALNVTKSGTNYPFMVKWSHPADPGAVPISWDETDPALDAGEADLAEGYDPIVDGLQLRDSLMIYKESSVWRMDYTGGPYVMAFAKVLGASGAMNRNCVAELDGFHFVLTGSDCIVHDGQTATSVLDKSMRRSLFQLIDAQSAGRCFVFKNPFLNEVFACFPEAGATTPNLALVWNYKDRTVAFRDIPSLNHAAYGPVEIGLAQPWDGDASPWSSDITLWNASEFTPDAARVLMASNDQKLFLLDSSTTFDGAIPQARLERRGLSLGAPEQMKLVRGVRPRIFGNDGETVTVRVGGADDPYSDPTYGPPMTFTIGQATACDCMVTARYPAVRFENGTAYQWRLDSYDLDVEPAGSW
jgi:hypothetical protein